ncbi:MAG: M20/M25/M40 family metallo-hydrolase [Reichenbachiella sp.]
MKNHFLLLSIIFLFFSYKTVCQVNKIEKKIVESVNRNNAYYIDLLKEIVNMNSGTMNFEGVKKVGMRLKPEFEALGFDTRWEVGNAFNRAGHLVAVQKGKKGPNILLIGHLDTVFEKDSPFQEYKMINDSIMQGPGVADMKGGDVIILEALRSLKDAKILKNMSIEVVLTGEEENSGRPLNLSKKVLFEASERADIALAFENGDGNPKTIVTSRRGSKDWTLEVAGVRSHSSQVFTDKVGVGAIYETSRILNEFYLQLTEFHNLTFNPGVILGGTSVQYDSMKSKGDAFGKKNVVAQKTIVTGDLRATSLAQQDSAMKIMKQICRENYPGTSAQITFRSGGYPPLAATKGNMELLSIYNEVSQDLGYGEVIAVDPRKAGAADVSFTASNVEKAVDGLGLSGGHGHTIDETGNLNKMPVQAKRAAVMIYRLTRE